MPTTFLAALLLIPLASYATARRLGLPESRLKSALGSLLLTAAGLVAAAPFLTDRAVGTGEAYNYSLALADAVLQLRTGEIPPLAGQTEFAFNGRIHPLCTAPYLFYLSGALDVLTAQRLSFWSLQNLSLAFSLLAAVHACYLSLRWATACPPGIALALSLAYGFSPALLTSTYWYDLYMTVHTAPFLPVAVAASLRQAREPRIRHAVWLALGLGGAWLAHPPVALWLTGSVGLISTAVLFARPSWRELGRLGLVTALTLLLAGFVFASVLSLRNLSLSGSADTLTAPRQEIVAIIRAAFPGCLLPVPHPQNNLCNLQLGYSHWALLALALATVGWRRPTHGATSVTIWSAQMGLLLATLLLLALLLPVPGLTAWLWGQVPAFAILMTSIWPMQRLYLVATVLILFAAAEPLARASQSRQRLLASGLLVVGLGWIFYQAVPLLRHGFVTRWSEAATRQSHLSTNLNLTKTSYAYLDTPPHFLNAVMDPFDDFQLIQADGRPAARDASAPPPNVVSRGRITWPDAGSVPIRFTLEPKRRYRLRLHFVHPPILGHLLILGRSLTRTYQLAGTDSPAGFGMGPTQRHSLSLWTSESLPEEVSLQLIPDASVRTPLTLAEYSLEAVDPTQEPVVVHSLLPLHATISAPPSDTPLFLETCRRYLTGYTITVNQRAATPLRSPAGQLMVSVPPGRSEVVVRYEGPPLVRRAFIVSATTWLLCLVGLVIPARWADRLSVVLSATARWLHRQRWRLATLATAGCAIFMLAQGLLAWRAARAIGPIEMRVRLPALLPLQGRAEPLLVTGRAGAGDLVYVRYLDAQRISFGYDHWGISGVTSEAITLNDAEIHTLEIHIGSLYADPADARWGACPADQRVRRRQSMELKLNGRVVLTAPLPAHPTTHAEITPGLNLIGGSTCGGKFSGEILAMRRLPPTTP